MNEHFEQNKAFLTAVNAGEIRDYYIIPETKAIYHALLNSKINLNEFAKEDFDIDLLRSMEHKRNTPGRLYNILKDVRGTYVRNPKNEQLLQLISEAPFYYALAGKETLKLLDKYLVVKNVMTLPSNFHNKKYLGSVEEVQKNNVERKGYSTKLIYRNRTVELGFVAGVISNESDYYILFSNKAKAIVDKENNTHHMLKNPKMVSVASIDSYV